MVGQRVPLLVLMSIFYLSLHRRNMSEICLLPPYLVFCRELQSLDKKRFKDPFVHCCPWWLQSKALLVPKLSRLLTTHLLASPRRGSHPYGQARRLAVITSLNLQVLLLLSALVSVCVGREEREFTARSFSRLWFFKG